MFRLPPSATRIAPRFPSTTLSRSVPSPDSRLSAIHRQPAALRGYHLAYPRDHGVVIRRVEHVGDGIGQLDTISFDITARGHRRGAQAQAGGDERRAREIGRAHV